MAAVSTLAATRESRIEKRLLSRCREVGFLCWKFTSPARRGVPDRMLITPAGIVLAEVKRPGEVPDALQRQQHVRIRRFGGTVFVIDSVDDIEAMIAQLQAAPAAHAFDNDLSDALTAAAAITELSDSS